MDRDRDFDVEVNLTDHYDRFINAIESHLGQMGIQGIHIGIVDGVTTITPDGLCSAILRPSGSVDRPTARIEISVTGSLQNEVITWREVVFSAVRDLSRPRDFFPWWAMLGPDPLVAKETYGRSAQVFSASFEIGGMSVVPSGRVHREAMPVVYEGYIGARDLVVTSPAIILGETERRCVIFDSSESIEELCLLSSLISLYFDVPWIVRNVPNWLECDPSLLPTVLGNESVEPDSGFLDGTVPEWFEGAWDRINQSEKLQRALLTRLEAQRLAWQHPSFALVAFMSCVQTVGSQYERDTKKALRKGLARVLCKRSVDDLMRFYSRRGFTVHDGLLYGKEPIAGFRSMSINPFESNAREDFERDVLVRWGAVSRRILINELSGSDPGDEWFAGEAGWKPYTPKPQSERSLPVVASFAFGPSHR